MASTDKDSQTQESQHTGNENEDCNENSPLMQDNEKPITCGICFEEFDGKREEDALIVSNLLLHNMLETNYNNFGETVDEMVAELKKREEFKAIQARTFHSNFPAIQFLEMGIRNCKHKFCTSCTEQYLTTKITDGDVAPERLCCPEPQCDHKFEPTEIFVRVNTQVWNKYIKFLESYSVSRNPYQRFCSNPACAKIVAVQHPNAKRVECTECQVVQCFRCGGAWTRFHQCEIAHKSFLRWANGKNIRRCPGCDFMIEKNGGCSHMTCQRCRYEFCWYCRVQYHIHMDPRYYMLCPILGLYNGTSIYWGFDPLTRFVTKTTAGCLIFGGAVAATGLTIAGGAVSLVVVPPVVAAKKAWRRHKARKLARMQKAQATMVIVLEPWDDDINNQEVLYLADKIYSTMPVANGDNHLYDLAFQLDLNGSNRYFVTRIGSVAQDIYVGIVVAHRGQSRNFSNLLSSVPSSTVVVSIIPRTSTSPTIDEVKSYITGYHAHSNSNHALLYYNSTVELKSDAKETKCPKIELVEGKEDEVKDAEEVEYSKDTLQKGEPETTKPANETNDEGAGTCLNKVILCDTAEVEEKSAPNDFEGFVVGNGCNVLDELDLGNLVNDSIHGDMDAQRILETKVRKFFYSILCREEANTFTGYTTKAY